MKCSLLEWKHFKLHPSPGEAAISDAVNCNHRQQGLTYLWGSVLRVDGGRGVGGGGGGAVEGGGAMGGGGGGGSRAQIPA